MEKIDLI